ncbi:AIM24 family protein [Clostridium sp. 'White wine YQ']|uniref:AIM24 family protein n=1 Tax=Clostridium sp. 'White wine YQ' TaxID=3027474 RepID=UPI0023658CD0|nr:AIM24 family protein [Clostridium sp. 'White wine YQ']MDD7793428.1 AIM24 family protein [Clostridium sp. 'White wine YQ']
MVTYKNLYDNKNIEIIETKGNVKVLEYKKDLSVNSATAINAYFASEMNVRKRQVLIELNGNSFVISAGAMQWTAGKVGMGADVKGFGDLLGKALSSKVTKESAIKPKYEGNGLLMLEPTYKHILLEEVSDWGGLVLDDGLFLACEGSVQQKVVARTNLSSAVLGKEGLFNLCLRGKGIAVLESPVPRDELVEFVLQNDEVRIDGNYAIAWSDTLDFRVEKSGKSLIGSAVSGEGLVNVYRGTGRILMAPIA